MHLEGHSQVVSAVQQVQSQFASFQQTMLAGFNLNLGAKLAETVLQTAASLRAAIGEGLRYAAGLKDMGLQSGLTAEAVQVLGHAAAQAGGSIENVRSALTNLRQAANAAEEGNTQLAEAFATLGLNAAELTRLPLALQLEAVARAFAASGNDGRSFAALIKLLGERDVPRLQGLLQDLAQNGLAGMARQLRENGGLLTTEMVEKADRLADRWGNLSRKSKVVFAELGLALQPVIAGFQALLSGALSFVNLLTRGFKGIADFLGVMAGAITGEVSFREALDLWKIMTDGAAGELMGQAPPPSAPRAGEPGKASGPSPEEMLARQRAIALAMLPLAAQRQAATEALAAAEQELNRVIAEGNAQRQFDPRALAAASLGVTEAKARLAQLDERWQAALDKQAAANEQLQALATALLPLEEQRAAAAEREAAATAKIDALWAADAPDLAALTAAERARLQAVTERLALEKRINEEQAKAATQAAVDAADSQARALAARRASLEGDFRLTTAEKWPRRRQILQEEIAVQLALVQALQAQRDLANAAGDTAGAAVYDGAVRGAATQLHGLQNQAAGLGPDPASFSAQLQAALTGLRDQLGTFAEQTARAFSTVGDSLRTSLGAAFADMILKATSFRDAMIGFGNAIATAFINSAAQMAANWLYEHTFMAAIRSLFKTKDVAETAAAESAKTGLVVAGGAARTAAVAAESAASTGITVAAAGTQSAATGIAGVFRALMELGPIAGPLVLASSLAGMIALVSSLIPREAGGPVTAGRAYLVGEKRPEIFVPHTDGFILPNVAQAMMRPGLPADDSAALLGASAAPAGPAHGGGSGQDDPGIPRRESGRNIHIYLDRSAWLDAVRNDLSGLAHEIYDQRARA
jgi:hypothetical protein